MSLTTQVPDAGTPIFDSRGYISTVWHEFFFNLLRRTGGSEGAGSATDTLARLIAVEILSRDNGGIASDYAVRQFELLDQQPVQASNHGQHTDPALHDPVSGTANGFMIAADKTKLDSVVTGAAVASVGATSPITSTGGGNPTISINAATTLGAGSMSANDKTKIDSLTSFTNAANSATVTVTNTTADTNFLSAAVSANTVQPLRTMSITVCGTISGAASGGQLTLFIKVNGLRFSQVSLTLPASAVSAKGFMLQGIVTYRTSGSGSSVFVSMSAFGDSSILPSAVFSSGSSNIDTTIAGQIDVGASWGTANAANIVTGLNSVITMEKS